MPCTFIALTLWSNFQYGQESARTAAHMPLKPSKCDNAAMHGKAACHVQQDVNIPRCSQSTESLTIVRLVVIVVVVAGVGVVSRVVTKQHAPVRGACTWEVGLSVAEHDHA